MRLSNCRGQGVLELALFGAIFLVVAGVLISYVQRLNDQQYVKMEVFRRALQKANTYQGKKAESPGASVQMVQVEHRRHADVSGGQFGKGMTQYATSDAHVFWAIPTEGAYDSTNFSSDGAKSKDLPVAKINDDEKEISPLPNEFYVNTKMQLEYAEAKVKSESPGMIANSRQSQRKENIYTTVPGMSIAQDSYRDQDGQYRYYSDVPSSAKSEERSMSWQTAN